MSREFLEAPDYVIFVGVLLISVVVGVFFAIKDRGKQSTENYYFGERKISPIPVAASLSVSFVSAIAIIGLPVEVYLFGTIFAWNTVAQLIATVVAVAWYVPLYHRLKLTSVYQYLELRFNRVVRIMASALAWINLFLYLGIVIYLPALALSAVTPLSLYAAIALTSVVCTFYTTIGGMKAVVWTDLLQAVIMISGILGVFIQTVIIIGGLGKLVDAAERTERRNFLKYDGDPRTRSTIWTVALGLGLNACFETGCNQVFTQRYLSCRSIKSARIALLLTLIPGFAFTLLSVGNGLALNAFYEGCDPFTNGDIEKIDQSVPHLAVDIFQNVPGMAGLFVSAVYCGTLSTVSSGINAMSALILHDFILPFKPDLTSRVKVLISILLCVLFGMLVMTLAYLVTLSTSNIVEIFVSLSGWIGGPMIGLFTMGLFMPWVNSKGAFVGFVCGWAFVGWVGISAMLTKGLYSPEPNGGKLSLTNDSCVIDNSTLFASGDGSGDDYVTTLAYTAAGNSTGPSVPRIVTTLYSVSPFLYGVIGFLVCMVIGNITSLITGFNKPSEANPKLFVPVINSKIFRFGVPEAKEKTQETTSTTVF